MSINAALHLLLETRTFVYGRVAKMSFAATQTSKVVMCHVDYKQVAANKNAAREGGRRTWFHGHSMKTTRRFADRGTGLYNSHRDTVACPPLISSEDTLTETPVDGG
jgi:hypothetical protein